MSYLFIAVSLTQYTHRIREKLGADVKKADTCGDRFTKLLNIVRRALFSCWFVPLGGSYL